MQPAVELYCVEICVEIAEGSRMDGVAKDEQFKGGQPVIGGKYNLAAVASSSGVNGDQMIISFCHGA